MNPSESMFENNGYVIVPNVVSVYDSDHAASKISELSEPGIRSMLSYSWCINLASSIHSNLVTVLPCLQGLNPVQCTLFQKKDDTNWLVAWHQDRSVPLNDTFVKDSVTSINNKNSVSFIQPSAEVLEKVVAIRLHLDDCDSSNGPLRFIPSSHCHGILNSEAIAEIQKSENAMEVVAKKGTVLAMKPLLLHASSKSVSRRPRRVLHFVFM